MSYNTRLGICIPTYKRPDQLRRCVESVIAAAAPFDVPVLITDDSTDDTNQDVIAQMQAAYSHLVYERNAQNLGIDGNILHCVDICPCEYAWILGEDDRMTPAAVATLLPILERNAPAFAAVNYSYVDENISVVLRERQLKIEADKTEDSETFFRNDAWAIGFIGSCVVNKSLWQKVDAKKYLGTYFAHVGVILESIAGQSVYLVAAPLILNRIGGPADFTWSDDAYGVFHGWSRAAALLEPVYGAEATQTAIETSDRARGLNTLRFLISKRADGQYNRKVYDRFIKNSHHSLFYKWFAFSLSALPSQPFQGLVSLLSFVRSRRNRRLTDFA